jgi:hypothetical protein
LNDTKATLDFAMRTVNNDAMEIPGRIQNGVVVLEGGRTLPEGMPVTVSCPLSTAVVSGQPKRRVAFPLVPSKHPGSLRLTADRVAELLEEDDVSPGR